MQQQCKQEARSRDCQLESRENIHLLIRFLANIRPQLASVDGQRQQAYRGSMFASQLSPKKVSRQTRYLLPRLSIYSLYFYTVLLLYISKNVVANLELPNIDFDDDITAAGSGERTDDCESCVTLVKSFEKGLERTMRGKHEGGDTSWEEKHLKNYVDSEVRLVEIQDDLCNEVSTGKAQCLSMAETGEQHIEEWWFEHRSKNVRLHDYLCISKLKKCCPEGTYGPKCQKCPDCNGHGKCDGSGTRTGSGECNCNQGYKGKLCGECDNNYYRSRFGDEGKFECLKCHKACKGGCSGPTSANCTQCAAGYARDPETNLCNDINECELGPGEMSLDSKRLCKDGTYCENTDGHYQCLPCHHACQTCLGFGPNKCLTCLTDYHMNENHSCIHFSEQAIDESDYAYIAFVIVIDIMVLVILNYCTTKLARYLLRVTGFRDMEMFDQTALIVRLFLSTPIAFILGNQNPYIIRSLVVNWHKVMFNYLFGGFNSTESASQDAQSNISHNLEL